MDSYASKQVHASTVTQHWAARTIDPMSLHPYDGVSDDSAWQSGDAIDITTDDGGDSMPYSVLVSDPGPDVAAALPSPTQTVSLTSVAPEVSFIDGLTSAGGIATTSYWTDNSANVHKWMNNSPASVTSGAAGIGGGTVTYYFDAASNWSAADQASFVSGLKLWSAVANIQFAQASSQSSADFIFTRGSDGGAYTALSWYNTSGSNVGRTAGYANGHQGKISIDTSQASWSQLSSFSLIGGYGIDTITHEEGHLLGLGHAGNYNGSVNSATQQYSAYDTRLWSVMSYIQPNDVSAEYDSSYPISNANWGTTADYYSRDPYTWMPLDIIAAQQMYGAAVSTPLSGGQVFGFNCNIAASTGIRSYFDFTVDQTPVITLYDAGTGNRLDLSGYTVANLVDLRDGHYSSIDGLVDNIAIAFGTKIDSSVGGTGNDTFIANADSDTINGGGGTDTTVFAGTLSQYRLSISSAIVTVAPTASVANGTDTLTNIRYLQFTDFTLDTQTLHTITFSEYPVYTVNPVYTYADNTITVLGQIVEDDAQPASPAVAANTSYFGPVAVGFQSPVLHLEFDSGFFDYIGSSTITVYGPGGTVLSSQTNTGMGIIHYDFTYASGISGFAVNNTSYDPSGFSVDTITTDGTLAATPKTETISISPVSAVKSAAAGTTGNYTFTVTRSGTISAASSVAYVVTGTGSNPLTPTDITGGILPTGTVSFAAGQATAVVTLSIAGAQTSLNKTFSVNLFAPAQDTTIATSAANGAVLATPSVSDFNGDGLSDVLLQNVDGTVAIWTMNGTTVTSSTIVAEPGPTWHVAGSGDVNGDGMSDILLQNDDGSVDIWQMNGGTITASAVIANPGTSWHVIAAGDLNGDGLADVLLQNNDGSIDIWQTNGSSITSSVLVANPGPTWHAIATGDFDGDGKSDILFQNDDGSVDVWLMNGASITASAVIANPGTTWHAVGAGDFDGDGKSDILLQNNDGTVDIWQMNGTTLASSGVVANPGPTWHVVAAADYNGDGMSDIILQNDDGTDAVWEMNGSTIISSVLINHPPTSWDVTGVGSRNFINETQATGTVNATILSDDFLFTTSLSGVHAINGFDPLHDMITLDQTKFASYAAVQQNETQVNGGTAINLGNGSTLTLNGVLPTALSAKNFV